MIDNVFNKVGSLTVLRNELNKHGIYRFKTLNEIAEFKVNYNNEIKECVRQKELELTKEIEEYQRELVDHKNEYLNLLEEHRQKLLKKIEDNERYIEKEIKHNLLIFKILKNHRKNQNEKLVINFEDRLIKPFKKIRKQIEKLENKITTYTINYEKEVERRSEKDISNIHYISKTLKELNPTYYGAIGELQAVKALSKLDSSYYIINDYQLKFNPPIYDRRNDDRIYSIQVDHIVVGPTGVFVIETKNWNQNSINSLDLFSPIKQLKRSSFALFVYLNDLIARNRLKSFNIQWGNKKITIKNILLMTNATTQERFQFVKVTTINSVNKYIINQSEELDASQISDLVELLTS